MASKQRANTPRSRGVERGLPRTTGPLRRFAPALLVAALYAVPLGNNMWNPNELSHLMLSVSLSEFQTVQLDPVIEEYGVVPQDMSVRGEHAYSDKAPGLSLIGAAFAVPLSIALPRFQDRTVPDYWPLRHTLVWLLVALPTALLVLLLASDRGQLAALLTARTERTAVALLLVLATPLVTYGSLLFSHVTAGVMIAVAYHLVRGFPEPAASISHVRALGAGLLASLAVLTEYPTILLAGIVAAGVVADRKKWRSIPMFTVGALLGLGVLLAYNKAAWDSYVATGYQFKATAEHAAIHARGISGVALPSWDGLWGVLFSARRGLFFYCPMLFAVALGLTQLWRRSRFDAVLLSCAAVSYVAFAAGFVDWEGGWSAAARHLVPVLPLLFVPFALGIEALFSRVWSTVIASALVAVSLAATLLSVAVTPYFPELFSDPLAQVALRSLAEGVAMQNLPSDLLGVAPILVFAVYAVVMVIAVGAAWRTLVRPDARRVALAVFLATLVAYPVGLYITEPIPATQQEGARADLLRRIGHVPPAASSVNEGR